jgi:hypothetical protein
MTRLLRITLIIAWGAAAAVRAETHHQVYVYTGENGEVSFSDVAAPGAEPVELTPPEAPPGAMADLQQRIEQTLRVAKALEQSRLAREAARAQARRQAAADVRTEPQVIYQDQHVDYPYVLQNPYDQRFPRHRRWRGDDSFDKSPHGRGERDRQPDERSRSREFIYDPD